MPQLPLWWNTAYLPMPSREDDETYYKHIKTALEHKPQLTVDDSADLVSTLHKERGDLLNDVIGTEETTTGVIRLRSMERDSKLKYPIIALMMRRLNTSSITATEPDRALSTESSALPMYFCREKVVIIGCSWCGHGAAMRAKGLEHSLSLPVKPCVRWKR